jgi:hypothetical protein
MDPVELARRLDAQAYRCAYPCGGDGHGGQLRVGDALALADDGHGLVHLACARVGVVEKPGECLCGCGLSLEHLRADAKYASDACRKRHTRRLKAELATY